MRLRLYHTILRKQSISTDHHEESEDDSITSSLSSSAILFPNSFIPLNHRLRQSTPSLFPTLSSSQPSTS